jgi:excisionase family DNA binding protein
MADEMYTTKQAALYLGVSEGDIRLAVRQNKLKAWTLPNDRGLLVRKADLVRFRSPANRASLTRQLPLFTADAHDSDANAEASDTTAA